MYLLQARKIVAFCLVLAGFTGCRPPGDPPAAAATAPAVPAATPQPVELKRYQYAQLHMGVQGRLIIYAPEEELAERAAYAAFQRVAELDQIASDYRTNSELNNLARNAVDRPVKVSEDLFIMLERAQQLSRQTDGAFDVTIGPLIQLWRQARKTRQLPPAGQLEAARQRVGWEKLKLNPADRTVQLEVAGMQLDLGGVAKGYAGDQVMKVLRTHGIDSALFEFGGDIVVTDAPPGREGWMVRIVAEKEGEEGKITPLTNAAISTSGDLEQYVVIDGKRYSHVVDPRTGIGTTDRALITVIGPDGLTTDTLATAGGILGERARDMEKAYPGVRITVRTARD